MKIYIVQKISSGIAECPTLFIDEEKADKFYIDLVNTTFGGSAKTEQEATDFLREQETVHDILYWISKIE